ncbi:CheR family methyltransferase [Erythrobacter sp.]|uniref:CheR family methyltransferase n=1 Tax=Erythrobacter sp. TaxID=1042 RepID=UPI003C74991F
MPTREAKDAAVVPGVSPQVYSQTDFERIARLVHGKAGIVLSKSKKMLAYSRLAPLLRKHRCATFAEYLELVDAEPDLAAKTIAALTTNHTYFNREPHHFEHFDAVVREDLLAKARRGEKVRIWSAGSSSGEEIWTLMMVLLGADRTAGKSLLQHDIIALASDLAPHAIEAGAGGRYDTKALEAVPEALRRTWCRQSGKQTEIGEELRALVRFRQLNLLGDWPVRTKFDVIFCRNVMIYFDHPTKERLVSRLVDQLQPRGYLYIGHSERVSGDASAMVEPVGPTIYRRRV